MYLKKWDSVEEQALQWGEISKYMRIHEAKHGSMQNDLSEWFLSCSKEQYCGGWPNIENRLLNSSEFGHSFYILWQMAAEFQRAVGH
jgi:hypothetical protein